MGVVYKRLGDIAIRDDDNGDRGYKMGFRKYG